MPSAPGQLTRGLLERYLVHVHARELSTGQKGRLLGNLRSFLDDVRMHAWAPGLAGNATYFEGEIPHRSTQRLPRFVDEFVMGQIESEDNLARLPDLTIRTAIVLLIETGLRSVDALRLPFDPITVDSAGAPYLIYTNHKLAREAVIPISQRLLEQIRRQQADVARRFAAEQRRYRLTRQPTEIAAEVPRRSGQPRLRGPRALRRSEPAAPAGGRDRLRGRRSGRSAVARPSRSSSVAPRARRRRAARAPTR